MEEQMKLMTMSAAIGMLAASLFTAQAENPGAGRVVLTVVNRLLLNPPGTALVIGYFPTIEGLPEPLFAGAPGESSAYFTWSLDASGATILPNGDVAAAVLNSEKTLNIYFNAVPNQTWTNPGSFTGGQLVATFKSSTGTQTGSGPVALVTQSYALDSSSDFVFKNRTFNFRDLIPHGFTIVAFSSNIPLTGPPTPGFPLVFAAAGSGFANGAGSPAKENQQ
jgi:hypothetical protein